MQFVPQGEFNKFTSGETLSAGDVVCLSNSNDTVVKADSTDSSKMPAIGFVKSVRGGFCIVQLSYIISLSGSLNVGQEYWVSTGGSISNSPPSTNGSIVQKVGAAINSNKLLINIETQTINL